MKNRILGFTLAEVLITLSIIGIVASMIIPSLFSSYQEMAFKKGAKKAFSQASSALAQIKNENGNTLTGLTFGKDLFKPYYKVLKDCVPLCVPVSGSSTVYKSLLNMNSTTVLMGGGQFITADGSFMGFNNLNITVDVNGYKKPPNAFGKDTFMFVIDLINQRLIPMGASNTTNSVANGYCNRANVPNRSGAQGFGCMFYVLQDIEY